MSKSIMIYDSKFKLLNVSLGAFVQTEYAFGVPFSVCSLPEKVYLAMKAEYEKGKLANKGTRVNEILFSMFKHVMDFDGENDIKLYNYNIDDDGYYAVTNNRVGYMDSNSDHSEEENSKKGITVYTSESFEDILGYFVMVSKKENVRDEDIPACNRYLEGILKTIREKRYKILGEEEKVIGSSFSKK